MPAPHEHGLASGEVAALAESIDRAWAHFGEVIGQSELEAPSRKAGWRGRDIVAKLGQWEFGRGLSDLLSDAHDGDARFLDSDATDDVVRARAAELPLEDTLAAAERAREATRQWLASDGPDTWGLVRTSSPLGPLPVLTVLHAMTYQLSIATLDLAPCGAPVPEDLMGLGLAALVDTAGALAARRGLTGSFIAVTPERIVGAGSSGGHWRTVDLAEDPAHGPAVMAPATVVLDVTSGRANVGALYRNGDLRVRDLSGMVRLAPALDGVPGIPPLGAVGRALTVVDNALGGLLGRLRR